MFFLFLDDDVFDTWFTSTLLPLAATGWPFDMKKHEFAFDTLYPTNLLETGNDIMVFKIKYNCKAVSKNLSFQKSFFGLSEWSARVIS